MTTLDFTPTNCYEHLNHINNVQLFLISGSCPEHLKQSIQEHQLDMIEKLSTKLLMIKSGVTLDDRASTNGSAVIEE